MKMDERHQQALDLCIRCLQRGQSLATWIAGIPDEDRPEIIKIANESIL